MNSIIEEIHASLARLQMELEDLNSTVVYYQSECNDLRAENKHLKYQVDELAETAARRLMEITDLQRKLQAAQERY